MDPLQESANPKSPRLLLMNKIIMPEYCTETDSGGEVKPPVDRKVVQEIRKHQKLSAGDMVYALEMAIACAISYWIITYVLAPFVDKASDFLGGMWAVVATVFVFRD